MTTGEDAPAGPQEPRRRGDGEVTDHPVTAPEPWPAWLADLTPEQRSDLIAEGIANCYEDANCKGTGSEHEARTADAERHPAAHADRHLSWPEATRLLRQLLDEARQQDPVPSAEHSLAIAALTRLMLDEPLTELRDDDDRARLISRELTARMQYAAGTLETIRQLGQIPEQPEPLTHFTTAGQSRLAADNFPACEAQHWAIVSPYVSQVTCDDCLTWLGSAVGNLTRALANAAAVIERRDAATAEPDPEPPLPPGFFGRVELPGFRNYTGWITQDGADRIVSDWDGSVLAEYQPGPNCLTIHLPTPQKRPEPQKAITTGSGYGDYEPDDDDPWGGDGDDD